jgi:methylthioribose-1-phosphate isomerase
MVVATGARIGTQPLVALWEAAGALVAIDQTELPWREVKLRLTSAGEVADAIRRLAIRGAPLIGVAAAYGLALELARDESPEALERGCSVLRASRPTAVNLFAAVARVRAAALRRPEEMAAAAMREARAVHAEEERASDALAAAGADFLAGVETVVTHCNTGAFAAPGRGTALAVVAELARRGSLSKVIATESRPLLQGARLTVYELAALGIEHELMVDSAAPGIIASGEPGAVILGCDRVAANGDVANKVGTYGLALAARAAGIPFVVAGPTSTIDADCPDGASIAIEEREPDEVRRFAGQLATVPGTRCRNPAFDVTPAGLVTALVTERGVASPVNRATVATLLPVP